MQKSYYLDKLYPFQDEILAQMEDLHLSFYLTGGTALGRCYLNHRYSDDLDFFVNGNEHFKTECSTAISSFRDHWACDIAATSETFARIFVKKEKTSLKIDFVNDIPSHFGDIQRFPIFYRVDSWRNILSNKLCALSRLEAKDIADIVFIAKKYPFDWETIIDDAKEKDLWVDPLEICRLIDQFPYQTLESIKWVGDLNIEEIKKLIEVVHDDIFTGSANSLVTK